MTDYKKLSTFASLFTPWLGLLLKAAREWLFKHRFFASAFIRSQGARVALFLVVNVIFGALGFLVPISVEYLATDELYPALQKQLNAAGPYTFAIAFLAASVSLVVDEYLALDKSPEHRTFKVLGSILAGLLVVFCAVFSGSQTARELLTSSAASTGSAATVSQTQTRESVANDRRASDLAQASTTQQSRAADNVATGWEKFSRQDRLQIWTTALAICVGLALFLIFKWEEPSMQAELERYQLKTETDASVLGSRLTVPGR